MPQTDPASTAIELAERIAAEVILRDPDWSSVSTWARELVAAADEAGGDPPAG